MDLITVDTRSPQEEAESQKRVNELISEFEKCDRSELNSFQPPALPPNVPGKLIAFGEKVLVASEMANIEPVSLESSDRISSLKQTWFLLQRLSKNSLRDRSLIASRLIEPIVMGAVVALIFFQLTNTLVDITSAIAAIYSSVSIQPYLILLAIVIQCKWKAYHSTETKLVSISDSKEFPVFDREYSDKMVDAGPYFLAQTLSSLPWALGTPLLFCLPFYYIVDLREGYSSFLWFYAIMTAVQVSLYLYDSCDTSN